MELVRAPREWWDNLGNLADLHDYLRENEPTIDFGYLLRKPWKHTDLYQRMRRDEEMDRLTEEHAALEDELDRRASL